MRWKNSLRRTVHVAKHEGCEVLDISPDRHVHQYAGAVADVPGEAADAGGIAIFGLEPPDEARGPVGERVDGVKSFDKRC
jgi:hypothetical protein